MENCSFGTLIANLYDVNNAKAMAKEKITCMDVDTLLATVVRTFNRQCMELPKTFDGVPVRAGDKVQLTGSYKYVTVLGVSENRIFFEDETGMLKGLDSNLVRSVDKEKHDLIVGVLRKNGLDYLTGAKLSDISWGIMEVL